MSSRDPEELRDELRSIDCCGDRELLTELRSEARETVDAQKETQNDIDTKASRILRLNILLIGVLVSVLSIAAQNGGNDGGQLSGIEPFVNPYTKIGIGSLVLSTAFAAMTYTASELDVGVSSENLATLLEADFSREDAEELLVKNYIVRINFNRSVNIRNIPLIQTTIVFIITAVVLFALGTYRAVAGSVPLLLLASAVGLILGVVFVSGLPTQLRRAMADLREWR